MLTADRANECTRAKFRQGRLIALGVIVLLLAPAALHAADSVDVTFRYYNTSVPNPYLVGEFTGWVNSILRMNYAGTYWWYTERLAIGGNPSGGVPGAWQYKFYYSGASPWPNDPLNHHVNTADNDNTFIITKDPTIYQFLPNQRNPIVTTPTPTISAYIFPKVGGNVDTSALSLVIDGTTITGIGAEYNTLTKQLAYTPAPLTNGSHTVILNAGTNADTVHFTVQAGFLALVNQFPVSTWDTTWKINGIVGSDSVSSVRLVRNNADTFQVPVASRKFSFPMPLLEGGNSITALADSFGTLKVSSAITINHLVSHRPMGVMTFDTALYTVTLHADSSTNFAGIVPSTLTYRWSVDSTNPSPIAGVDGSTVPAITIARPPVAGEYYFNLVVSDTNGLSDTTRNYFAIDDSGNVTIPTLASNPSWVKQGRMYLLFFNSVTAAKTINAALPRLDYIKSMGYNIIWVLPVMKNAFPINNFYGPGYDIIAFYNVAPEYGTNDDFKNFVKKAHALGLKVILDVTPNHTSKYHPFVADIRTYRENSVYWNFYQHKLITNPNYHPNYSEALTSDSLIVYYYAFSDELLNYNWSDLDARKYMIDVYKYWVTQMGVDGFRFDVYWGPRTRANGGNGGENEMGVPVRQALKHVKPDILLLGEDAGTGVGTEVVYADRNGGVDMAYDWNLVHNAVQAFYTLGSTTTMLNTLNNNILNCGGCNTMGFTPGPNAQFLRFMENQDEDRIIYTYSVASADTSAMRTMPVATVLGLSVGVPLVYSGQEVGWGYGISGPKEDRNRSVIDWNDSLRLILQPFYQRLAQIRRQFSPFWSKSQLRVFGSNSSILGYSRPQNDLNGLFFVNPTGVPQTSYVNLSSANLWFTGGIQNGRVYYASDLLNDSASELVFSAGAATLTVTLPPYGSSVLVVGDTSYTVALPLIDGVNDAPRYVPLTYGLLQNYPNPFNPSTQISYSLPKNGVVTLTVYNILGQSVARLVNGVEHAGVHTVTWNAAGLPSGVYFYRLQAGAFSSVKKMLLVR